MSFKRKRSSYAGHISTRQKKDYDSIINVHVIWLNEEELGLEQLNSLKSILKYTDSTLLPVIKQPKTRVNFWTFPYNEYENLPTDKHFFKRSIFQIMNKNKIRILTKKGFTLQHISNIIQYTILYKYGGVYIDLGVQLTKPLDFVGKLYFPQKKCDILKDILNECWEYVFQSKENDKHSLDKFENKLC